MRDFVIVILSGKREFSADFEKNFCDQPSIFVIQTDFCARDRFLSKSIFVTLEQISESTFSRQNIARLFSFLSAAQEPHRFLSGSCPVPVRFLCGAGRFQGQLSRNFPANPPKIRWLEADTGAKVLCQLWLDFATLVLFPGFMRIRLIAIYFPYFRATFLQDANFPLCRRFFARQRSKKVLMLHFGYTS